MTQPDDGSGGGRLQRRLGRRFVVALIVGPLAGLGAGALIVVLTLDRWGPGAIGIVLGSVVACTLLAGLWAGYSSLESPDPGSEPSDTDRPIADRPSPVREEAGDPLERVPDHGLQDRSRG